MVTKQDFVAIARILKAVDTDRVTVDAIARELASYFKSKNSNFNRDRFLAAAAVATNA